MTLTFETLRLFLSIEVCRSYSAIRMGRFECFAQRQSWLARLTVTRPAPGEVIIDLPGVTLMLTNHLRFEAGSQAAVS